MALRCERCGDVIGVYEPMIVLDNGRARATSKAAEQDAAWSIARECYHALCYEQACGQADRTLSGSQ
jgi:hypothetical protein